LVREQEAQVKPGLEHVLTSAARLSQDRPEWRLAGQEQ
jgi:hypothetical protein